MDFKNKYLKYKKKYLELKSKINGGYPLDDIIHTATIDAYLNNPAFENQFYKRIDSIVVPFDRTNQNYTHNLFIPDLLDIRNLSDHQAFLLQDKDGSIIYSWNVLHSESLCEHLGVNSHFQISRSDASGNEYIIDVSNTKNQVTANIVSQMMLEQDNIKVFMLQECEYDIYLKLRVLIYHIMTIIALLRHVLMVIYML